MFHWLVSFYLTFWSVTNGVPKPHWSWYAMESLRFAFWSSPNLQLCDSRRTRDTPRRSRQTRGVFLLKRTSKDVEFPQKTYYCFLFLSFFLKTRASPIPRLQLYNLEQSKDTRAWFQESDTEAFLENVDQKTIEAESQGSKVAASIITAYCEIAS